MRALNGNECRVRKNLTPNTFGAATLSFIPRPGFSLVSSTLLNGKGFPEHSLIPDDR